MLFREAMFVKEKLCSKENHLGGRGSKTEIKRLV
jgi:hypothetical protein